MSARDTILSDVRRALAGRAEPAPAPRGYREAAAPASLVDLFVERVEDYRATVLRCSSSEAAAVLTALIGRSSVVVPPGLPWEVAGAIVDDGLAHADLDRIDAVVTTATVAIATTGTIVLDHRPGQGRRALSLVPDRHVCMVRADQIVAGVPEAVALLDPYRPQTWISGPSATSDIELDRVEGVHGPRVLEVVLIGG